MARFVGCAWLFVTNAMLAGCALPYYWQAAGGQLELLRKRTPIEEILTDSNQSEALREMLETVLEIRQFAVEELDLPDNDSYRSYTDLQRSHVVWTVVAAEEFSVDPVRWCFPFVGCVTYRGFFDESAARRFAKRLDNRGLDTYVAGSPAYSTLGYFADPVLNTMLAGGEEYLASVLFHELAHQRLYIKGDSELSEAFATTVEEYGTERWFQSKRDEQALERYRERLERRGRFANLIAAQQARLREVYSGDHPPQSMRAAKANAIESIRREYAELKDQWGGADDYDDWFAGPLNNAQLASMATYRHWLPGLRWYLAHEGLAVFYAELEALADLPAGDRRGRLESWLERALSDRSSGAVATADSGSREVGRDIRAR